MIALQKNLESHTLHSWFPEIVLLTNLSCFLESEPRALDLSQLLAQQKFLAYQAIRERKKV